MAKRDNGELHTQPATESKPPSNRPNRPPDMLHAARLLQCYQCPCQASSQQGRASSYSSSALLLRSSPWRQPSRSGLGSRKAFPHPAATKSSRTALRGDVARGIYCRYTVRDHWNRRHQRAT